MKTISIEQLFYFLFGAVIVCFSSIGYGNDDQSIDEIMAKARSYYMQEDYQQAKKFLLEAADKGNHEAMFAIGHLYYDAKGVVQSYQQAMEWFQKAAMLGDSVAMNYIANMYYRGYGVEQDYSKAKEWFEKAAKLGDEYSMFYIGVIYYYGEGVK